MSFKQKCLEKLYQEVIDEFKARCCLEINSMKNCELLSIDIRDKLGCKFILPLPQTLKRCFIDKSIPNPQISLLDVFARYIGKYSYSNYESLFAANNEEWQNIPLVNAEEKSPIHDLCWRCVSFTKSTVK